MADHELIRNSGFSTRAIHAGQGPDPVTGAVMTPIYQTSTYVQEGVGQHKGYEYARTHHLTRAALEDCVAALEGADHGIAYASGSAATHAIMTLLEAGDHVVSAENLYGGTHRLFEQVLSHFGLSFTYVDTRDLDAVNAAIRPETKMVFIETPSNPLMRVTDIAAVRELTADRGLQLIVDNTFMTPFFQLPMEYGADIVVHSTTKFLNGHSDMVGGMVLTSNDDTADRLRFIQNAVGAVPGPLDCFLALRGLKTLPIRMQRSDANAREIAPYLASQPKVARVHYPGLPDHPEHELAKRQMSGFGGIVSIELADGAAARRFLEALQIFQLAESLGGVESLSVHPGEMTHAAVPPEMREGMGLVDNLVRLSVGIEDAEDLIADLERGLEAV